MPDFGLREVLASFKNGLFPPDVPPGAPEDVSHCGCPLDAGCWGDSGWHFARFDKAALYNREKRAFADARPGQSAQELRRQWATWLGREEDSGNFNDDGVHRAWLPYLGAAYAFEPCGPYRASLKERLDAEKQSRPETGAATSSGRHYEAPANMRFPRSDR